MLPLLPVGSTLICRQCRLCIFQACWKSECVQRWFLNGRGRQTCTESEELRRKEFNNITFCF